MLAAERLNERFLSQLDLPPRSDPARSFVDHRSVGDDRPQLEQSDCAVSGLRAQGQAECAVPQLPDARAQGRLPSQHRENIDRVPPADHVR